MTTFRTYVLCALTLIGLTFQANAQNSPFGDGWKLEGGASSLQFQSIKKGSVIETSSFATMSGAISPDGQASLKILLDSVDTKVDLRNVRMRFLFFETFQFPEANVTAHKQRKLRQLAQTLAKKPAYADRPIRIDVVGVDLDARGRAAIEVRHHENAVGA